MPFQLVRQDITKMRVDAIVNAANTDLRMGGGVCGAIFHAAGLAQLQAACDQVGPIETGGAAITPGFALPAKFVIHAAGPVYSQWDKEQSQALLYSAYAESLKLALENGCESIAFPLISSGIYGYPKAEALQVATNAIWDFLREHDMEVSLCVFDKDSFEVSHDLMGAVASYIDDHYVGEHFYGRGEPPEKAREPRHWTGHIGAAAPAPAPVAAPRPPAPRPAAAPSYSVDAEDAPAELCRLDELIGRLDEPFSDTLLRLIDAKGLTDPDVYKKANLDRKLFSKIRTVKGYTPKKPTILALAVALELSLKETKDLLERAGYALSHASKFDVIIEYFIVNKSYNIFEINEVLFKYDQPLLGG